MYVCYDHLVLYSCHSQPFLHVPIHSVPSNEGLSNKRDKKEQYDATEKTGKTHHKQEIIPPPSSFNEYTSIIEFVLRTSKLPNLLLQDVVQSIEREQSKTLFLQPVQLENLCSYRRNTMSFPNGAQLIPH